MTARELEEYVAEAFFTYEQMRDQRDQALGRAIVAEQELTATLIALADVVEAVDTGSWAAVEVAVSAAGELLS